MNTRKKKYMAIENPHQPHRVKYIEEEYLERVFRDT